MPDGVSVRKHKIVLIHNLFTHWMVYKTETHSTDHHLPDIHLTVAGSPKMLTGMVLVLLVSSGISAHIKQVYIYMYMYACIHVCHMHIQ